MGNSLLTIHHLSGQIIEIIEESKEYCFLVTPYYKPWTILERAIEKAAQNEKKLYFIFRKEAVDNSIIQKLNKDMGFDVAIVDRLHTKLYFNEKIALVTSMNLYESSKDNNYEMGYLITGFGNIKQIKTEIIEDDILSLKSHKYFEGRYTKEVELKKKELEIKRNMQNQNIVQQKSEEKKGKNIAHIGKSYNSGYCIRCKRAIEINKNYPLCNDCYFTWSQFMNSDYQEKYCHRCGIETVTSKNQPFCLKCARIIREEYFVV